MGVVARFDPTITPATGWRPHASRSTASLAKRAKTCSGIRSLPRMWRTFARLPLRLTRGDPRAHLLRGRTQQPFTSLLKGMSRHAFSSRWSAAACGGVLSPRSGTGRSFSVSVKSAFAICPFAPRVRTSSVCNRCPGLAYLESGDFRAPSSLDCEKSFARTGIPSALMQIRSAAGHAHPEGEASFAGIGVSSPLIQISGQLQ